MRNAVSFFKGARDVIRSKNPKGRANFIINYNLLRKRNTKETSFVIGKIIVDTMVRDVKEQTMPASNSEQQQQLSDLLEHKTSKIYMPKDNRHSEEIPQIPRGLVEEKECHEAAMNHHERIHRESVGSSQDNLAKKEEQGAQLPLSDLFK